MKIPPKFTRTLSLTLIFLLVIPLGFPPPISAMTPREEEELSREFMKVVLANMEIVEDSLIVGYVNEIGNRILKSFPPQPFKFKFYVVKEDVYNAFAAPAGHIFINSGLLKAMESEEELAGILAHEISHSVCRHISDKINRSKKMSWATLAGVAAGALLGIGGAATAANAVTMGTMAATQAAQLAYSREDEIQADQIGLGYLNKSGYSARGLLKIMNKIRSKEWYTTEQIPKYLRTHPASEDRIAYIGSWIEANEPEISRKTSPAFNRAHGRLVALYTEEKTALELLSSRVEKSPQDPYAKYGMGLVLARLGQRREAIEQFRAALAQNASDPYILRDLGKLYVQEGQYKESRNLLEAADSLIPGDPETLLLTSQVQIETGSLEQAKLTVQNILEISPNYSQAYYTMGQIYGKQGNSGKAHYYLGVYYQKRSDSKNALFHLNRALKFLTEEKERAEIQELLLEIKGIRAKADTNGDKNRTE